MKKTLVDENGICYVIETSKKLGSGGQGVTYLTADPAIIIKIQNSNSNNDGDRDKLYEEYRQQIDEVRALMLTSDMHIADPIYMLAKPICGYVMKFMGGMISLNDLVMEFQSATDQKKIECYLQSGGLLRRLKLLREIAKILYKLRERSLVYADLSYNNVFISKKTEDCRAWLIDADNIRYNGELGKSFGTPECWAPEVASGEENTIFSDIYSFAILAHTFLTGQKPFCGKIFTNNLIGYNEDNRAGVVEVADDWGDGEDNIIESSQINDISAMIDRGFIPWIDDPNNRDNENTNIGLREVTINRHSALFDCFNLTFCREGRKNPLSRPAPHEWISAIDKSIWQIIICKCGWSYYRSENACPICDAKRPSIYIASVIELQYDDCRELIGERNIAELVVPFDEKTELTMSIMQPTAFSRLLDNDPVMLTISNSGSEWIISGSENMKCRVLDKSESERQVYEYEPGKKYIFKELENAVICILWKDRLRKISFKREG